MDHLTPVTSSIVVIRTAPPYSPIVTITLTSTDAKTELVSSLSGNLADYRIVSSVPGQIVLTSHKGKFKKTAELEGVVVEKKTLEKDRESLWRAHVYTKILAGKPLVTYTPFDSTKIAQ
jgi:hypothetical protein